MTTGGTGKEGYKEGARESLEKAKAAAPGVGFANVLPVLKADRRAARAAWNLDVPDPTYISIKDGVLTVTRPMGDRPYQLSWEDVIAEDWSDVSETAKAVKKE